MKKRFTLTIGPETQKALAKLARKTSLESGISLGIQDALEGCAINGLKLALGTYFPKDKIPRIRD